MQSRAIMSLPDLIVHFRLSPRRTRRASRTYRCCELPSTSSHLPRIRSPSRRCQMATCLGSDVAMIHATLVVLLSYCISRLYTLVMIGTNNSSIYIACYSKQNSVKLHPVETFRLSEGVDLNFALLHHLSASMSIRH